MGRQGVEVLTLTGDDGCLIDVRDWRKVSKWEGKLGKVDLVYHLAALMFVPYSLENPRETYEVNVLGTLIGSPVNRWITLVTEPA